MESVSVSDVFKYLPDPVCVLNSSGKIILSNKEFQNKILSAKIGAKVSIYDLIHSNDNSKWYEVPYLAQESIFVEQANIDGELENYSNTVPYILEVQKVPKRFSIKVNSNNTIDLQFGSGDTRLNDEQILPNTKNVGLGLANSVNRLNQSIDPSNFLKTNTFVIAPAGESLTIKYLKGGGIESNINTGDLTKISKIDV